MMRRWTDTTGQLNDTWQFIKANDFALALFAKLENPLPPLDLSKPLGPGCAELDIWRPGFSLTRRLVDLKSEAPRCQLCEMLLRAAVNRGRGLGDTVRFTRVDSSLYFAGHDSPILSLYGNPRESSFPS
jgi:hypothetical protein